MNFASQSPLVRLSRREHNVTQKLTHINVSTIVNNKENDLIPSWNVYKLIYSIWLRAVSLSLKNLWRIARKLWEYTSSKAAGSELYGRQKSCFGLAYAAASGKLALASSAIVKREIKTESTRKLSNFNFQWTKTLYQNNLKNIAFFFTFFKG